MTKPIENYYEFYLDLRKDENVSHDDALLIIEKTEVDTHGFAFPVETYDQIIKQHLSDAGLFYDYIDVDKHKHMYIDKLWTEYREYYEIVHYGTPSDKDINEFNSLVNELKEMNLLDKHGNVK